MRTSLKIFGASAFAAIFAMSSCDKVKNPYPAVQSTDLDQSLYPGTWQDYLDNEWPVFAANANTGVNVLIEDFTGHTCNNCPPAAEIAHGLESTHEGRVFVASIHTGPTGIGSLQTVQMPDYPTDWTNAQGIEIGTFFGSQAGSAFQGNPRGTVNRVLRNEQLTEHPSAWTSRTNAILTANDLRVNLQSAANYYPSTRGVFLHTEIDPSPSSFTGEMAQVVYLIEDSIVGDQKMQDNTHNHEYIHRDVMRGCIDGRAFGRTLDAESLNENGKYYLNYSYKLPDQYDPANVHLLIYVFDKSTYEVLQVIEQRIQE
jgi:hypothetical protein